MDKKSGRYIVLGMVVGAVPGAFYAPGIGNSVLGILGGALAGVFIGWFVTAASNTRK